MAVARVGSPVAATAIGGVSSKTFSVTAVGGANNLLVVYVGYYGGSNNATATVTYNGVAMTLLGRKAATTITKNQTEAYGLINPPAGAHDVVITFSAGGQYGACGAQEYSGVDASTPVENVTSAEGSNSDALSTLAVTSASGNYAAMVEMHTYGIASGSFACTQSEVFTTAVTAPTIIGAARDAAGASTVNFAATWTTAGLGGGWSQLGFSIKANAGGGDATAPVLSSPTGAQTGSTTASGGVTTDEGNGTLYAVCTTSGTAPSAAQVKAGQDNSGSAATYATSQAVSGTGAQVVAATGLTASTTYYWHFMHEDAATNQSTVSSSASFTTTSGASAVAKIIQQMRA